MTTSAKHQTCGLTEDAIDTAASEWLLRRDAGLDVKSRQELETWLDEDPRHRTSFQRLEGTWAVFDRANKKGIADRIVAKLEMQALRRQARRQKLTIGGGVAALCLISALWWAASQSRPVTQPVAAMFEPVRTLPDGSVVELKPGGEVAVRYQPTLRRIELVRGEAYFRVQRDATRPFVVVAGAIQVMAIGTAFTVQYDAQHVEVVVAEGKVAVKREMSQATETIAQIEAGDRLRVELSERVSTKVSAVGSIGTDAGSAVRDQRVRFDGTPLSEAIARLNANNDVQIVIGDPQIAGLQVSGSFSPGNPRGFVRMIEGTFGLVAEWKGEKEVILRRAP